MRSDPIMIGFGLPRSFSRHGPSKALHQRGFIGKNQVSLHEVCEISPKQVINLPPPTVFAMARGFSTNLFHLLIFPHKSHSPCHYLSLNIDFTHGSLRLQGSVFYLTCKNICFNRTSNGFAIAMRMVVSLLPFAYLKFCYGQIFDDSSQNIRLKLNKLRTFQCQTKWCYFSLPSSLPSFLRSVSFSLRRKSPQEMRKWE